MKMGAAVEEKMAGIRKGFIILILIMLCIETCASATCADTNVKFNISEDVANGSLVGNIAGSLNSTLGPPYQSPFFTYSWLTQVFDIAYNTGIIKTISKLDREVNDSYSFDVRKNLTVICINILVLDVNDCVPTFSNSTINLSIPESAPHYKISIGSAVDQDIGQNTIAGYKLVSGNTNYAFNVTGRLSGLLNQTLLLDLGINGTLDFESTQFYVLLVVVYDGGTPALSANMTINIRIIDVNDNSPIFNHSKYSAAVMENTTVGTSVLEVHATDRDSGENGRVTYYIDNATVPYLFFTIDSITGIMYLNKMLDYVTNRNYKIIVIATDHGVQPHESPAVVEIEVLNVNKLPAVIYITYLTADSSPRISENASVGDPVARVSVSDPEFPSIGSTNISVTLQGGDGYFSLKSTGVDTYTLQVAKTLDSQAKSTYNLTVTATDSGSPPLSSKSYILVQLRGSNDNAPKFEKSHYEVELNEISEPGTSVITVTATDNDIVGNANIKYYLKASNVGEYSEWFEVDSNSGLVTTRSPVDCEVDSHPSFWIVASDQGQPPLSSSVLVVVNITDTNDNAPAFDHSIYYVSVQENKTPNTCILQVNATDLDCGVNGQVHYSITELSGSGSNLFYIKNVSGEICVNQQLDYELYQMFEFSVAASDTGNLSSLADVQISIVDVNDNFPEFYPRNYSKNIEDTIQLNTEIITIHATDNDSGQYGKVAYTIYGNSYGKFAINADTGIITVVSSLAIGDGVYTLVIDAYDGGGLSAQQKANVIISVTGPGRNPPQFERSLYRFTVSEAAAVNSVVNMVKATYNGSSNGIYYSITSGDKNLFFNIELKTGIVHVNKTLDHDEFPSLLLNVMAAVSGTSGPLFGYSQVNITIEDINDNAPVFTSNHATTYISEAISSMITIYVAHATDKDSRANGYGDVTYRLGNLDQLFMIDATSGELRLGSVGQQLDYETTKYYDIIIIACDQDQSVKLSSNMTLSVFVQDANDNPPVFSNKSYIFNVSEVAPISYEFAQVFAKDNDSGENGRVTFRLMESEISSKYGIFPSDGVLYLKDKVDYETRTQYTLTVIARDHGQPSLSATAIITVNVIDSNDNTPVPSQTDYHLYIEENHPSGMYVGTVTAADGDSSDNAKLRFYFNNAQTDFSISNTGVIQTLHSLDRELVPEYIIDVTVADSGIPVLQASVRVYITVTDVNDHAPAIQNSNNSMIQAYVSENQRKGAQVVQINGWDPDAGLNGTITFSLLLDGDPDAISSFAIHPVSGWITTKEVLDYQVKATYKLKIVAMDFGSPSLSTTTALIVYVNKGYEETGIFYNFTNFNKTLYVAENTPIGTTICNVQSYDNEVQNRSRVFYYIVGGNTFGLFAVELLTGNVYSIRTIDYEEASAHVVAIKTIDHSAYNPRSAVTTIKIYVIDTNDNPPLFDFDPVFLSLKENTAINIAIDVFTATDADSGVNGTVKYKILSSTVDVVYIDTNTGQLALSRNVDYEQVKEILLVITATDQCPSQACQLYTTLTVLIMVLDVNDNAPQFSSYQPLQVYEDEDVGYMIALLAATDADSNVNKSGNNWLTYTIKTGNIDRAFQINEFTGILTIAHPLDRELVDNYSLVISARDHGIPVQETTTTLVVHVLDVNDNSPRFQQSTYQCSVLENSNIGTVITVSATDADAGNNSQLTYSIPDGIVTDYFTIDPITGAVSLVPNSLDREQRSSYVIPVYVQDAGYPLLFDMAILIINVTDANDNPPTFKQDSYITEIPENMLLDLLYIFVAHDVDVGDDALVKYSITGGNDEDKFRIDLQTGILSCQKPLDREMVSKYELTITATDGKFFTLCQLYIRVMDQNDNRPSFKELKYTTSVLENATVGSSVVSVFATDADEGRNGMVTYSFSNDTDASVFAIDTNSGVITTRGVLDREKKSNYTLDVVATDGSITDQLSVRVRVEVTVGDINDNSPFFTEVPYRKVVPLNTGANTALLTVAADDKDYSENAKVVYAFSNQSDAIALKYFQINAQSGTVSTKQTLGSNVSGYHNLMVIATDGGTNPLSTIGVVEIIVGTPGADNSFAFQSQNYSTECRENPSVNFPVISVSIYSYPLPATYSFAGGNVGDAFTINSEGLISVSNPVMIDYETSHSMKLTVAAVSGSMYAYTTVWIHLTDSNDNPPVFSQERYNTKVLEEQPKNTSVMQVIATDADSPGPNSEIIYNIIAGNVDTAFVIYPPSSGIIQTNLIVDYEIRSSYTLTIEAKDNGIPPKSNTCTVQISLIDINDTPPKFPNTMPANVSEDDDVGTFITTVTANDVDDSSKVTYNFSNLGNPDAMFIIDAYRGSIYLAKRLDYELRKYYAVGLQVSDGKYSDSMTLNIFVQDVNDNAPVFSQQSYQIALDELTVANKKVLQVNATDADNGASTAISYSLAESSTDFYINNLTGVIYTSAAIQYQLNMDIIRLVVCATDGANVPLSAYVAVSIQVTSLNKYDPVFVQDNYTATVVENANSGSFVACVEARDNDLTRRNKEIIYTIISGNIANVFTIDQSHGDIRVNAGLDRELVSSYSLKVMARDRGFQPKPKSATASILILLQDFNDNIPYFEFDEYCVVLNESFPSEVIFLKIKTYDMDTGINGKVTYTITSGNDEGLFSINRTTGELFITPKEHLDYEHFKYHQLVIKATDCSGCIEGTPIFTNITTVHINVTDINEFSPEFPVDKYIEDFKENNLVGSSVFEAHANDWDGGYFGNISYTLVGTTLFSINNTTGFVTTNATFDYEMAQQFNFSFKITATDNGGKSATINVVLYLQDVDEFLPILGNASYTFSIPGSTVFGTLVGTVHATDADKGYAGIVIYKFSETNGYFGINSTTGEVRVKNDLNKVIATTSRKKRETISLTVVVSNGMDDSLMSSAAVIFDVNRACPGCALVLPEPIMQASSSTVTIVVLIVVIVLVALSVLIALILFRRRCQKKKAPFPGETTTCVNAAVDEFDYPVSIQYAPNFKDSAHFSSENNTANGMTLEVSHRSGSSGRGSAEDDEDEELAMINFSNSSSLNNSNGFRKNMPDSGIQEDDSTSEPSVQNHQDYLARLGIDTAKINSKAKSALTHSVESMHHFSGSGGGDGDGLENIDSLKLHSSHINHDSFIDKNNDMGFHEPEHNMVGSLSNVINSEEEYSGSYNWDYLLDWGPQYLPLANVFSEIARLKDDKFQPKMQTVQIVPQKQLNSNVIHQVRTIPPPMITSAPPQVAAGQPVSRSHRTSRSSGVNSMHNSTMNTSLPMPRSPITHESSSTSPALTPSFTPSLSPLATRSPAVSPVNSGRGMVSSSSHSSGPNTPRGHPLSLLNNNQYGFSSSSSEQEIQI